jgi:hypothetical protein
MHLDRVEGGFHPGLVLSGKVPDELQGEMEALFGNPMEAFERFFAQLA